MHNSLWYAPSEERPTYGGVQRIYRFEGGSRYTASVVQHQYSYGGAEGRWELAVMYDDKIVSTPVITGGDDVIGWLTEDEVQVLLAQVDALQDSQVMPVK